MWIKQLRWGGWFLIAINSVSSVLACEASALTIQPVSSQSQYDVFNTGNYATINTYRIDANII